MIRLRIDHRIGEREVRLSHEGDAPILFLIGQSGVGKTSLLNMIAGLIAPDRGHIAVAGRTLFDRADGIDVAAPARGYGYQFQDNRLFPHMSVAQNLRFAAAHRPVDEDEAKMLAERLGLTPLMSRHPANLSGGESRRVALVRAMLAARTFLLLDEPTASLNPARQNDVRDLIAEWQEQRRLPVIIASHDAADRHRLGGDVVDLDSPR